MLTRAEREKKASDESNVYENWYHLRDRFSHIFYCPNTVRMEPTLDALLRSRIAGKRVLEIGCGKGYYAVHLSELGAAYVCATDIAESFIAEAKAARELPGKREYIVVNNEKPIEGRYAVIVGRAVLHHLDYRETLSRLARENLEPDGLLIFAEPLASNPFMRLFRSLSTKAHTADERAFDRHDLDWIRQHFSLDILPFNFISIPIAALSSFLFRTPDNWLTRLADRVDMWLSTYTWLHPYFRTAVLVIHQESLIM